MPFQLPRRQFLGSAAAGVALSTAAKPSSANPKTLGSRVGRSANDTITVGIMGLNSRGSALAQGFAQQANTDVTYVCDVDSRAIGKGMDVVSSVQDKAPKGVEDFRQMLDDDSLDVLVVAAPNHWHAIATILGCQAGKHVYVEKPCSHTPAEGEWAVKAARDNDRVVTMGTQRRSREPIIKAIAKVHDGAIGKVRFAKAWYNNRRGPIGEGKAAASPSWLNYQLWQGPCTEREYQDNLVHYNWHWFWHWGNGELGNNGVHALDLCRWGLQADFPTRVTSAGGRYRFNDDQETADTHLTCFEFGDKLATWEGLSWSTYGPGGSRFGCSFHGDDGTLVLLDTCYQIYDQRNQLIEELEGTGADAEHFADFLGCIRDGGRPTADIEEGHKSTLLCHLGNIAQRTGESLDIDPATGHLKGASEAAQRLWSKEYREGWQPKV